MQKCKYCGAEIRYIAVNSEEYAVVDPVKIEVYTENGHKHTAYQKHVCEKKPEEENAGK